MAIYVLSGVTLVFALFGFVRALDLVPTDLGFAWMTGAFTLLAASLVIVAIGLAARRIEKAIQSALMLSTIAGASAAAPAPAPARASEETAPEAEIGPAPVAPAPAPLPAVEEKSGLDKAAMIGAAGLAAGAAATLTFRGAKAVPAKEVTPPAVEDLPSAPEPLPELRLDPILPEPMDLPPLPKAPALGADDAFMAELEKDIFADLPAITMPSSEPASATEASRAEADHAPDDAPEAEPAAAPSGDAPATEMDADIDILLPAEKADNGQSEPPPAAEPDEEPEDEDEPAIIAAPQPEPAAPPAAHPPEAAAPPPGLIRDADLIALDDAEPALAPLNTLDVVGSYDSGGTRFTMYSDGSVTAIGNGIDRRFPTLDALRAFIDGGAKG